MKFVTMRVVIFAKSRDQKENLASALALDAIVLAALVADGVLDAGNAKKAGVYSQPVLDPPSPVVEYPVDDISAPYVLRQGFGIATIETRAESAEVPAPDA